MLSQDEHRKALQAFEIDRLLKMLAIEGKKHHDGHWTIFSFTTHYKVAFGTPDLDSGDGRSQVHHVTAFESLKDAVINAIVEMEEFEYCPWCHQGRPVYIDEAGELFHFDLTEQYARPCEKHWTVDEPLPAPGKFRLLKPGEAIPSV